MPTNQLILSFCPPILESIHVYLNGVEQRHAVDWELRGFTEAETLEINNPGGWWDINQDTDPNTPVPNNTDNQSVVWEQHAQLFADNFYSQRVHGRFSYNGEGADTVITFVNTGETASRYWVFPRSGSSTFKDCPVGGSVSFTVQEVPNWSPPYGVNYLVCSGAKGDLESFYYPATTFPGLAQAVGCSIGFLSPMDVRVGDKVEALYAHLASSIEGITP